MDKEKSNDCERLDASQHQHQNSLEEDGETASSKSQCQFFSEMTPEQRITVITFSICNVTVSSFYGMIAPFFPGEASRKGTSPVGVGFIFGIFQATIAITSPIFGSLMTRIGAKRMYASGILLCGICSILFGFLNLCPDGNIFLTMCLFTRFLQGLGASAFYTADCAIIAEMFPKNFATIFGSLEFFMGLGVTIGPVLGGSLYQIGGYMLPFVILGIAVTSVGLLSIFFLPKYADVDHQQKGSIWSLMKIPVVSIVGFCLVCGAATFGYVEITLSSYLKDNFQMSEALIGFVFLLFSGTYAFSGIFFGFLSDKYTKCSLHIIMCGCFIAGLFLHFIGPAPFLYKNHTLWFHLVSVGFIGSGVASVLLSFPYIVRAAIERGYPNDLATFGLCSGLFNTGFALGACVGPIIGGILVSQLSFETSSAVVGECVILSGLILMIYIICLKNKQDDCIETEKSCDTSRRSSTTTQFSQLSKVSEETKLLPNTALVPLKQ